MKQKPYSSFFFSLDNNYEIDMLLLAKKVDVKI